MPACFGAVEEPETAPAAAAEKEEKAKAVEKTLSKKVRWQCRIGERACSQGMGIGLIAGRSRGRMLDAY